MSTDTYEPARVHIASSDVPLGPARAARRRRGFTARSFILTANDPVQEILPQSDKRCEAWITAIVAQQLVEPANPAAGSAFTFTVTQPCQLETAFMKLSTSATAGNRFVVITIADAAGNEIAAAVNNTATAASSNTSFAAAQGAGTVTSAGAATQMLPVNLTLQPGWTITFGATGLVAGDQVSNIAFTLTANGSCAIAGTRGDAQAAGNAAATVLAQGTPFPVGTSDQVWAAAAFQPTTISLVAFYDQDG